MTITPSTTYQPMNAFRAKQLFQVPAYPAVAQSQRSMLDMVHFSGARQERLPVKELAGHVLSGYNAVPVEQNLLTGEVFYIDGSERIDSIMGKKPLTIHKDQDGLQNSIQCFSIRSDIDGASLPAFDLNGLISHPDQDIVRFIAFPEVEEERPEGSFELYTARKDDTGLHDITILVCQASVRDEDGDLTRHHGFGRIAYGVVGVGTPPNAIDVAAGNQYVASRQVTLLSEVPFDDEMDQKLQTISNRFEQEKDRVLGQSERRGD